MRMRHPAIVSVVAVFQDTIKGSVMLQMPYNPDSHDCWLNQEAFTRTEPNTGKD
jgi:hypothetical protein